MKKKILIYAYLEGNFGDDLMVWVLCKRYPEVQFYVLAHEIYKIRFRELDNLKVFGFQDKEVALTNFVFSKLLKKEDFFQRMAKKADAVVHIGGSVFVQHEHYRQTYMIDVILQEISRKIFVCGANFGPYQDKAFYRDYYDLFQKYDAVCFRDKYSYELFRNLKNIRYAPDIVFHLGRNEAMDKKESKSMVISVIDLEGRSGKFADERFWQDYKNFITALAERYVELGYQIKFVAFCTAQGDEKVIDDIRQSMHPEKQLYTEAIVYRESIQEILKVFDECEIVVGTRFHSIILGWLRGKRVLPIVYDLKTYNVLKDNEIEKFLTINQIKSVEMEQIEELIGSLQKTQLRTTIEEAEYQFYDLDKFLGRPAK